MLRVAFVGTFAATLAPRVRELLSAPCDVILCDEAGIVARLPDLDVLVTLVLTREMAGAARRLKLVQVPGAGLDRIDRTLVPAGAWLANAYGHETGIAEYAMGAILAWTREYARLDAQLRRGAWASQWAVGAPPPAQVILALLQGYERDRASRHAAFRALARLYEQTVGWHRWLWRRAR